MLASDDSLATMVKQTKDAPAAGMDEESEKEQLRRAIEKEKERLEQRRKTLA